MEWRTHRRHFVVWMNKWILKKEEKNLSKFTNWHVVQSHFRRNWNVFFSLAIRFSFLSLSLPQWAICLFFNLCDVTKPVRCYICIICVHGPSHGLSHSISIHGKILTSTVISHWELCGRLFGLTFAHSIDMVIFFRGTATNTTKKKEIEFGMKSIFFLLFSSSGVCSVAIEGVVIFNVNDMSSFTLHGSGEWWPNKSIVHQMEKINNYNLFLRCSFCSLFISISPQLSFYERHRHYRKHITRTLCMWAVSFYTNNSKNHSTKRLSDSSVDCRRSSQVEPINHLSFAYITPSNDVTKRFNYNFFFFSLFMAIARCYTQNVNTLCEQMNSHEFTRIYMNGCSFCVVRQVQKS